MKHLLALLLLTAVVVQAQHVPTISVYRQFIDSAMIQVPFNQLVSEKPGIEITVPQHAMLIEPDIRQAILFHLATRSRIQFENKKEKIHFILETAELNYPELYRDGFLGEYYFTRNVAFKGSSSVVTEVEQKKSNFSFSFSDTLKLPLKDSIETAGYALTQKALPAEPVFLSLWEPLTVVAALGITVYLFFTTRSSN